MNNFVHENQSWKDLLISLSEDNIIDDTIFGSDLSYPEFFDALSLQNKDDLNYYLTLKNELCHEIAAWEHIEYHKSLVEFARSSQLPILTTNFDLTLIDNIIGEIYQNIPDNRNRKPHKVEGTRFTDYYPWYSYYCENSLDLEENSVVSQFAIWHIHGIVCYPRSLNISAIDYGNHISRYKKLRLQNLRQAGGNNWQWKNSWLEIFFKCDLLIVGLALSSQETSLRWLLMQREKLFRDNILPRKRTVYVVNREHDSLTEGKKYFFQVLNITICEKQNSQEIYGNWGW